MESNKHSIIGWLVVIILLLWPPNWVMRWKINRNKRRTDWNHSRSAASES